MRALPQVVEALLELLGVGRGLELHVRQQQPAEQLWRLSFCCHFPVLLLPPLAKMHNVTLLNLCLRTQKCQYGHSIEVIEKATIGFRNFKQRKLAEVEGEAGRPTMAPKRGHRQRGAGTVTVSRGEQLRQGVMCKEWQRTPMQLLLEFCQSKKRRNPIYHPVRASGGKNRARCVLPDDKNSSKDLAFCPEQTFESMDEAKHCAALLALKYVEPLRPHERKLPDPYRDLWLALGGDNTENGASASSTGKTPSAKSKKKEVKPAAAANPEPATQAKASEENSMDLWGDQPDEEEAKPKAKKIPLELSADRKFASQAEFDQAKRERVEQRNRRQRSRENRERANIPKSVMMSASCREEIERVLRDLGSIGANAQSNGVMDGDIDGGDEAQETVDTTKIASKLRAIGFQEKHCKDALRSVQRNGSSQSDAEFLTHVLDWLCLNVPENELPKQFNPEGTQLDVVLATKSSEASPSSAVLVQRLMKFGYDRMDAIQVANDFLREHGEVQAASPTTGTMMYLLQILFPHVKKHFDVDDVANVSGDDVPAEEDLTAMRQDEIFALEAIYDDKLKINTLGDQSSGGSAQVLELEATDGVKLSIFLPASTRYPFELPLLAVTSPLAKHQSLLLAATGHALQSCKVSIGEPMLYDIYVAVDSYLQDAGSRSKETARIQLMPVELKAASPAATPPPAPSRIDGKHKSQRSNKSKRHKQRPNPRPIDHEATRRLSEHLLARRREKESDSAFDRMQKARAKLPAHKEKHNVLECVRSNQVVLIRGQTGCGKTTQVPQFILDEYVDRGAGGECQIICTQPRRIAAIGVATRVAQERCEQIADVVGYQIRMDAKKSSNTRLLFCTTGVLLRRLLTDRALAGVSVWYLVYLVLS